MVDYHVDRLGVEAWQHVKLTSTNRSIGLITSHADKHRLLIFMKDIDALINILVAGVGFEPTTFRL